MDLSVFHRAGQPNASYLQDAGLELLAEGGFGSDMTAYVYTGLGIVLRLAPAATTNAPSTHQRSLSARPSSSGFGALMPALPRHSWQPAAPATSLTLSHRCRCVPAKSTYM